MAENVKIPENIKNHTFLDLWIIGTPDILLKFIKFKPGLLNVVQLYFIKKLGLGVQKCSKMLKMAHNVSKYH